MTTGGEKKNGGEGDGGNGGGGGKSGDVYKAPLKGKGKEGGLGSPKEDSTVHGKKTKPMVYEHIYRIALVEHFKIELFFSFPFSFLINALFVLFWFIGTVLNQKAIFRANKYLSTYL